MMAISIWFPPLSSSRESSLSMEIELNSIARYSLRVSSYVEAAKPALVFLTPVFLM
jgi:hypothetical protein